jgi:hypothetical protein
MILRAAASGQLDKVAQGSGTDLKIVYCIEVEGTAPLHTSQTLLPASHAQNRTADDPSNQR